MRAGLSSMIAPGRLRCSADDEYRPTFVEHVHPSNWVNPNPAGRSTIVIIGVGTAGLGAKVALVERHLRGGDCLNVGYVPSTALIRVSKVWAQRMA